jgi:hypothetical protein
MNKFLKCTDAYETYRITKLSSVMCRWDRSYHTILKDQKRRPEGGEWEPIKILWGNLVYVPKLIWRAFLLTRLRLYSYREVIDPRNQVRQSEITAEEQQSIQAKHVQDHDNQNRNNEATHNLICISPNNLWMWPRNHEQYTRRMKKAWDF